MDTQITDDPVASRTIICDDVTSVESDIVDRQSHRRSVIAAAATTREVGGRLVAMTTAGELIDCEYDPEWMVDLTDRSAVTGPADQRRLQY